MDSIQTHFPQLSAHQCKQLNRFIESIQEWNQKINVISRKDTEKILEHHLIPSLILAQVTPFKPNDSILDIGSGGGFPGIPLAICFPETQFTLVDSVGKKIKVIEAIKEDLGLENLHPLHARAENIRKKFDSVTGRAVTALPKFLEWVHPRLKRPSNGSKHGVYYLKGGPLEEELTTLKLQPRDCTPLNTFVQDPFYEDKYVAFFAADDVLKAFKRSRK